MPLSLYLQSIRNLMELHHLLRMQIISCYCQSLNLCQFQVPVVRNVAFCTVSWSFLTRVPGATYWISSCCLGMLDTYNCTVRSIKNANQGVLENLLTDFRHQEWSKECPVFWGLKNKALRGYGAYFL